MTEIEAFKKSCADVTTKLSEIDKRKQRVKK